jgi:glycosyltransferase involved in cell wall biosynthesis
MDPEGRSVAVLLPGPAETPTGGFVYDRHIIAALRRSARLAEVIALPDAFPDPSPAAVVCAARALAKLPDGRIVLADGLALTPLLPVLCHHLARLSVVALVHHPLCDETGLSADRHATLFNQERSALARVRGVIVTSRHTARRLADFAVPTDRIRVVPPGVGRPRPPLRRRPNRTAETGPRLLCVGSLVPRKGQDLLLRSLAGLRRYPWRLDLVGSARDRRFAARLQRLAHNLGIAHRVRLRGSVRAVDPYYRRADLFVLPSHHEGFGMALAEAAAHRIPIVTSAVGAIPEALAGVPATLLPPGKGAALTHALRRLLARPAALRSNAAAIRRHRLRPWSVTGGEFLAMLDELLT